VLLTLPLHRGKAAADVTADVDVSSDKAVAVSVKGRFYFCQKLLQLTVILLLKKYV
jgi:hypothetical protein